MKNINTRIEEITFEEAKDKISFSFIQENLNGKNTISFYVSFLLIIGLEIFLATGLSGLFVFKPLFAIIEWVIVISTITIVVKSNLKTWTQKYLKTFHQKSSIIFLIKSAVVFCSLFVLFLTFSFDKFSNEYVLQIVFQSILSIVIGALGELFICKYLNYRKMEELAQMNIVPSRQKWGKIVEKSVGYSIALILLSMQFYRMNKFWIDTA